MEEIEIGSSWIYTKSAKVVTVEAVATDHVTLRGIHWPFWLRSAFIKKFEKHDPTTPETARPERSTQAILLICVLPT